MVVNIMLRSICGAGLCKDTTIQQMAIMSEGGVGALAGVYALQIAQGTPHMPTPIR